jgi:hypothetical protein
MASNSQKIIIVLTQFHFKQLMTLYSELNLTDSKSVLIFPEKLNISRIDLINPRQLIKVPFDLQKTVVAHQRFFDRLTSFTLRFVSTRRYYRSIVDNCKSIALSALDHLDKNQSFDILIFNDRDFLAQILIKSAQEAKFMFSITAIDEGIGYYIREGLREKLLRYLYRLISRPLLGFNYQFIEQYGTHSLISEVYLQYPELLERKVKNVIYKKIPSENCVKYQFKNDLPGVLIFTAPFTEDNILTAVEENNFYRSLYKVARDFRIKLFIKPHPREGLERLARLSSLFSDTPNVKFIDGNILGEEIDYLKFDLIINFGSSVIMHIISHGFLPRNIITVKVLNFGIVEHLFGLTQITKLKSLDTLLRSKLVQIQNESVGND